MGLGVNNVFGFRYDHMDGKLIWHLTILSEHIGPQLLLHSLILLSNLRYSFSENKRDASTGPPGNTENNTMFLYESTNHSLLADNNKRY